MSNLHCVHSAAEWGAQLRGRSADTLQTRIHRQDLKHSAFMPHREADPARRGDPVLRMSDGAGRGAAVQVPVEHVLRASEQPLRRHLCGDKTMPECVRHPSDHTSLSSLTQHTGLHRPACPQTAPPASDCEMSSRWFYCDWFG